MNREALGVGIRSAVWLSVPVAVALLLLAAPAHAAFPGKNGKIAFQRYQSPVGNEIYSANLDATGAVDLSNDNNSDTHESDPAWSPDGTHIAFVRQHDDTGNNSYAVNVWVMNADGSGQHNLTPNDPNATTRVDELDPAWSPDGSKIAFIRRDNGNPFCCPVIPESVDVWTMNADGTNKQNITNTPQGPEESGPAWSPDGTKIAYSRFDASGRDIYTVNADGSGNGQQLTNTGYNLDPNWSPTGEKIVFDANRGDNILKLWVMNADGTSQTQITNPPVQPNFGDVKAAWSPAGDKIVFERRDQNGSGLATVNPDGSGFAPFAPTFAQPGENFAPDWQPFPVGPGYARPKGATPFQTYLTVAYKRCVAPNEQHGAPLAVLSCNPPQQASDYLTVGTLDANGQDANAVGVYRLDVRASPADVKIGFALQDVRNKLDLSDYTGELRVTENWRMTDHYSGPIGGPAGSEAATSTDINFPPLDVACAATTDTTVGATCNLQSSANAVLAGAVQPGKRVNSELGQVQVQDGGADGVGATQGDNTLFMDEGIFVP
jgi:Tol biopolymer transport system component